MHPLKLPLRMGLWIFYPVDCLHTPPLIFPLSDEDDVNGDTFVVGDVVISVDTAERQAFEYGHSFEREMVYLLVHGIYHILGYTHDNDKNKEAMRQKEEEIMNKYNLSR